MHNIKTFKHFVSIAIAALLVTAHVVVALTFVKAMQYYAIYPEIFNLIAIIVVCILVIVDIIFFVGFKYRDYLQKAIVCILSICIGVGGFYGTTLLDKTTETVDGIISINSSSKKTETVSGLFVSYNEKFKEVTSVEDLKKFTSLKVGTLLETSENSIQSFGLAELESIGIKDYQNINYTNNTDLLFALIEGEVDVVIFSSMYKAIFKADENVDYTQYLDAVNEFGAFEKEIIVEASSSKKDLSKDPFNVLLIGWSPIIGSDTVGLADAIIVATVNPQTYTVSMMSIARDSYVPISCYGGECDKINSGRGTSMDCFVKTVEDLIGEKIDFYMEINFVGFAVLIDCIGGVEINNPVSFELDGVYVPAGNYVAEGWQALQFARERHHMPNGDFDRQQHQKEVIMQIAKKFINHDLAFALDVFQYISKYLNTNMTFNQLAGVFNMLKSTKNYTGLSLFKILDMHALRITGYADWHYSDDYELPLWIYRLYQGSIDESLTHMREVMGEYEKNEQNYSFEFNTDYPYERGLFYSTEYNEVETHEVLPAYYVNLTTKTYKEAQEWAKEKGATLEPTFIYSYDENYDESLDGMVISQSVAYGKKVEKYPVCKITVMGNGKEKPIFPDFSEWESDWVAQTIEWCKEYGYKYQLDPKAVAKDSVAGYSNGQVYKLKYDEANDLVIIKYYQICGENSSPNEDETYCVCNESYAEDDKGICKLQSTYTYIKDGEVYKTEDHTVGNKPNWSVPSNEYSCMWSEDELTFTCKKHIWVIDTENSKDATCSEDGYTAYKCSDEGCTSTKTVTIPATGEHNWVETSRVDATYTTEGTIYYECSKGHETKEETIPKLTCSEGYHYDETSPEYCVLD